MRLPVSKFVKQPEVIDIVKRYPEILKFPTNVYSAFLEEKSDLTP